MQQDHSKAIKGMAIAVIVISAISIAFLPDRSGRYDSDL